LTIVSIMTEPKRVKTDRSDLTARPWSLPGRFTNDQREAFTNNGPLLESSTFLKHAIDGIREMPPGDQDKVFRMGNNVDIPIIVFIDLDHAFLHGNIFRREIREALIAFRKTNNRIYGFASKLISNYTDDCLEDAFDLLKIQLHMSTLQKAEFIRNYLRAIPDDDTEDPQLIIFSGPDLIAKLHSMEIFKWNDLVVDVSDDSYEIKYDETSIQAVIMEQTLELQNYGILEYILYYIALHWMIRSNLRGINNRP
jgi:hypothetical protein